MTTVAVLADPPREGAVLTDLVERDVLAEDEAVSLYGAMVADVCEAVQQSGGELLVNYRPADQLPGDGGSDGKEPEDELRSLLDDALEDTSDVRFEVQVGSDFAARAGNTVTHLLEREGVNTAAIVTPTAAFLGRTHVDSAAMKLRQSEVVLGPSQDGAVYYAGFAEPIDFTDAYASPAIETLVGKANDADCTVDFLPMLPKIESVRDLSTALPLLRARADAGRRLPPRTAATISEFGLQIDASGAEPRIERE